MNNVDIREFFVEGDDQKTSHVLLHITEPSTAEEIEKGYFLALCEINNGSIEHIEQLQQIIDDIEAGYYNTANEDGDKNPFELTLEYINRKNLEISDKKIAIHCLVAVVKNNTISISYHGNPHAILFYEQKNQIHTFNILKEQAENNDSDALFSSVIEGNVNPGDKIFVATPQVTDHFSYDRLEKIITSRSIPQSVDHIEKVLKNLHGHSSFGGILCEYLSNKNPQETEKEPQSKKLDQSSAESLDQLLQSERNTAETLSPPLFSLFRKKTKKEESINKTRISLKKRRKIVRDNVTETNYRPHQDSEIRTIKSTTLVLVGRTLVEGGLWLINLIKKLAIVIGKIFIMIFILITNKNNSRREAIQSFKNTGHNLGQFIKELPIASKILLFGTIIAAILFISSIAGMKINEERLVREQNYNNHIQAIEDKIAIAEASIIYNDNSKAFTTLKEAQELTDAISDNGKESKELQQQFSVSIEEKLIKLRNVTVVSPQLLIDLQNQYGEINTKKMTRIDDTLVAYGPEDQSFYSFEINSKNSETHLHDIVSNITGGSTPKEQDKIVFLSGNQDIFEYNKETKTLSKNDIAYPDDKPQITDIFIYNLRLYAIDKKNNQIYKHNKTKTGYDKGSPWIKTNNVDLSDAVSLAVDGDIFVLKENGEILKFVSGKKEEFTITGLDPELSKPSIIWTYNDVQNIYILEPSVKRIVVLNKEGKLLKQYTVNEWQEPTGMIVDEAKKTIYVLDQNKIYSFGI
ncbi:MAG: hypothetical protein COX81_01975 [Candidatus Magasanikbacteria bacterium CG_4_10_14_0_2_um_filter_37_12]|uniref:PPM-type phosphatase domain-containing protein n=1 Tax=Candidatus Magasanikbacteria bacterium CG_4_10_14_0_2_um_filter_37_12 TaxID=1974637 RepID=A0A2M7V8C5_9BACT|nr:MAG: hypothetical protein COX81_01975 [Candidatus Magasanikbacteria bacterium CG_4_10_14_0_2_um_filter_37_12]